MKQSDVVLRHLKRHRTITSQQAWGRYSITRLADVVHKTTYAKYRIV